MLSSNVLLNNVKFVDHVYFSSGNKACNSEGEKNRSFKPLAVISGPVQINLKEEAVQSLCISIMAPCKRKLALEKSWKQCDTSEEEKTLPDCPNPRQTDTTDTQTHPVQAFRSFTV